MKKRWNITVTKRLHLIFAVAVVVVLIVSFLLMRQSSSYQKCYSEYYKQHQTQADKKHLPGNYVILGNAVCSVRFVDRHEGSVTALVTIVIAYFTFLLWWSTHRLWQSTEKLWEASKDQSKDMKDSIAEAVRSANAMERVATSMEENVVKIKEMAAYQERFWKMQIRAYLSINARQCLPYKSEAGTRYEVRMTVINSIGHTPAHQVRYGIRARILKYPLPDDINFSFTQEQLVSRRRQSLWTDIYYARLY